jgi:hypothetical protein
MERVTAILPTNSQILCNVSSYYSPKPCISLRSNGSLTVSRSSIKYPFDSPSHTVSGVKPALIIIFLISSSAPLIPTYIQCLDAKV